MLFACELECSFNNTNPEISAMIQEVKGNITSEKLQEQGRIHKKEKLEIYGYFIEKSDYVEELLSQITGVKTDIDKADSKEIQEGKTGFEDCIDDDKTRLSSVKSATNETKDNVIGDESKENTSDEQSFE